MIKSVIALLLAVPALATAADPRDLERGTATFRTGDYAGAIADLERAHAAEPGDADTALLLGISYYKVGRSDDARGLLELAEAHGDADAQASARVFLGLIADDSGDGERARSYFSLVAASPTELRTSGQLLLDRSGPERWSIVAVLRPGYDSNVALMPATALPPSGGGDADMTLIAAVTGRPSLDVPLVLDETVAYRKQATLTSYDMLSDAVGGTLTFAGPRDRVTLGYHFEAALLGGARYETGHVGEATYRHVLAGEWSAGAQYTFAARDYAQAAYTGYSGLEHTGVADVGWHGLSLGYEIDRDATTDAMLAATSQGARATARIHASGDVELRATAVVLDRVFDEAGRRDVQARGDAAAYVAISRTLGVVLGSTFVRNASSAADFDYTKWTVFAGLVIGASS